MIRNILIGSAVIVVILIAAFFILTYSGNLISINRTAQRSKPK